MVWCTMVYLQVSFQPTGTEHIVILVMIEGLTEEDVVPHTIIGDPRRLGYVGQGTRSVDLSRNMLHVPQEGREQATKDTKHWKMGEDGNADWLISIG